MRLRAHCLNSNMACAGDRRGKHLCALTLVVWSRPVARRRRSIRFVFFNGGLDETPCPSTGPVEPGRTTASVHGAQTPRALAKAAVTLHPHRANQPPATPAPGASRWARARHPPPHEQQRAQPLHGMPPGDPRACAAPPPPPRPRPALAASTSERRRCHHTSARAKRQEASRVSGLSRIRPHRCAKFIAPKRQS